jgi:N-acetylmuramoyl-L-alanine amidase
MGRILGIFLAAMLLGSLASPAVAQTAQPSTPSPAVGVRFGGDDGRTRVVLDLGLDRPGRLTALISDGRLVIELPLGMATASQAGAGHGLVRGWTAQTQEIATRVVMGLGPGALVQRRFLIPPSAENVRWRYVIDLAANDPLAALVGPAAKTAPRDVPAAAALIDVSSRQPPASAPVKERIAPAAKPGRAETPTVATVLADWSASPPPAAPVRERVVPDAAPGVASSSIVRRSAAASAAITPSRTPVAEPPRVRKVIVVDAGHGGHDTGARSLVRNEKDITLASALALKARLERSGRYRVVLTRADDTFVPLDERVRIARNARADLFISLHADSAGQDPRPHGASVYTLSDHGVTRVHEVLGPHDVFTPVGDRRADPAVSQILLDLAQRDTRNRSAEFSSMLIDHLGQSVDMLPHGQRDAGYFVLLAPDVPAVLLEMGFITNPADEMRLTDPDQRQEMMDRVADAIDDYFAPRREVAQR